MSDYSLIKLRRSTEPYKIPTVEQLEFGELAANVHDGKLFLKVEQDQEQKIVEFTANIPFENAFFVRPTGDDRNTGTSWSSSVKTIERALELAGERNSEATLIDLAPGVYETEGHIDMPDNCMIRSVHRTVIIKPKPGFEERNVIRMGSGCFIEGPVFEGWRLDDLDNPTEGFAIVFRPGATITRVPYAHKIVVRSTRTWDTVAPPLDRDNQNPLVGRGGGVALADGAVLSPYSIFPNIMTWGATPVSHNGIGYCAKNGALINAVNAISLWAHKHFYAIDGGQIVLSSCSTQFGDFTMVSKGTRKIVFPQENEDTFILDPVKIEEITIVAPITVNVALSIQSQAADAIETAQDDIINNLWNELVANGYTAGWTSVDELYTRRNNKIFLEELRKTLETANEEYILNFVKSLFYIDGITVFAQDKLAAFVFSFTYIRDQINNLANVNLTAQNIVSELTSALNTTIQNPVLVSVSLSTQVADANLIASEKENIVNNMWTSLVDNGYTIDWNEDSTTETNEILTKRDARNFINAVEDTLINQTDVKINSFIRDLFYADKTKVFSQNKLSGFLFSFNYMRSYINSELNVNTDSQQIVDGLVSCINYNLSNPSFESVAIASDIAFAQAIVDNKDSIINNLWNELVVSGYTTTWNAEDELYTRRESGTFLQSISWVLQTGNEKPILDFVKGLFDYNGSYVFNEDKLPAFVFSFNYMRDEINNLPEASDALSKVIISLVTSLTTTLLKTETRLEPSIITAVGHTWSGIMAGVALTKIPPARNLTTITESILELDQGVVISSGQDDQGSALFVGGLEINADTGELTGPPFDQAVNRIATRTSIARSY